MEKKTISTKLFTVGLESIFCKMNWEGGKINGEYLNRLWHIADISLISDELNAKFTKIEKKPQCLFKNKQK